MASDAPRTSGEKLLAALVLLMVSVALMEIATVWHVWGVQALVWLFVAKWMLILCFDLPAAPSHTTGRPNE